MEIFKSDAWLGAMCSLYLFLYYIQQAFHGFLHRNKTNRMDINKQAVCRV